MLLLLLPPPPGLILLLFFRLAFFFFLFGGPHGGLLAWASPLILLLLSNTLDPPPAPSGAGCDFLGTRTGVTVPCGGNVPVGTREVLLSIGGVEDRGGFIGGPEDEVVEDGGDVGGF